jgi:hypothetical protein
VKVEGDNGASDLMVATTRPCRSPSEGGRDDTDKEPESRKEQTMTKKTSYHSTNGNFTGKTVTESGGGHTKSTSYTATGSGLSRTIMGPGWKATSTTTTDPKGNTRTTKY